jgi:hypothetical protein
MMFVRVSIEKKHLGLISLLTIPFVVSPLPGTSVCHGKFQPLTNGLVK